MHSETPTDLSLAGLQIAIQDIKDELFDTPECDYAVAQLLSQWGQAEKAEQLLDEMLLKWGASPDVLALTQRGYAELPGDNDPIANSDGLVRKPQEASPATLEVAAA